MILCQQLDDARGRVGRELDLQARRRFPGAQGRHIDRLAGLGHDHQAALAILAAEVVGQQQRQVVRPHQLASVVGGADRAAVGRKRHAQVRVAFAHQLAQAVQAGLGGQRRLAAE